ncbi:MAG: hypothetical protein GF393_00490 [Armatimonadia bacterium]|nr:hypothetical protein [Armatimonadia bacterium]
MARRLTFDGYDGSRPVALPGVPGPVRGAGRAHSLARTLEIALKHAGLSLGYDAIMGLSGLAFRTPPWPDPPALTAEDATGATDALSKALGDCFTLHGGDAAADEARVLDMVAASISDGRPCVALGWGSDKDHWSLIAGYDRGKNRLIGHSLLDTPREQYESWPPAVDVLVVITALPSPRGPEAVSAALQTGAQRWSDQGLERYGRWIDEIESLDAPPDTRHERAVELLADARASAASFADQIAELERQTPAAWLVRAAEHWREVVMLLEARGVPGSPEAMAALETADRRSDWAGVLRAAAEHEAQAASAVRLSASADYLPEEAARW